MATSRKIKVSLNMFMMGVAQKEVKILRIDSKSRYVYRKCKIMVHMAWLTSLISQI
jgi:hypothetical protein